MVIVPCAAVVEAPAAPRQALAASCAAPVQRDTMSRRRHPGIPGPREPAAHGWGGRSGAACNSADRPATPEADWGSAHDPRDRAHRVRRPCSPGSQRSRPGFSPVRGEGPPAATSMSQPRPGGHSCRRVCRSDGEPRRATVDGGLNPPAPRQSGTLDRDEEGAPSAETSGPVGARPAGTSAVRCMGTRGWEGLRKEAERL